MYFVKFTYGLFGFFSARSDSEVLWVNCCVTSLNNHVCLVLQKPEAGLVFENEVPVLSFVLL